MVDQKANPVLRLGLDPEPLRNQDVTDSFQETLSGKYGPLNGLRDDEEMNKLRKCLTELYEILHVIDEKNITQIYTIMRIMAPMHFCTQKKIYNRSFVKKLRLHYANRYDDHS